METANEAAAERWFKENDPRVLRLSMRSRSEARRGQMDNFLCYWVPLLVVILVGLITINSIDRRRQSRKASEREAEKSPPE